MGRGGRLSYVQTSSDFYPHLSATLWQPHFPALQKASNEAKGLPLRGAWSSHTTTQWPQCILLLKDSLQLWAGTLVPSKGEPGGQVSELPGALLFATLLAHVN